MKKLNTLMLIIAGAFGGVAIGRILFTILDYSANADIYAMASTAWYTPILGQLIITAGIYGVLAVVYLVLRKIIKSKEKKTED